MKIVIDGRMLGWTGIGRYTKALLEELEQLDRSNEYAVLIQRKDWGTWEPSSPNFHKVEANSEPYRLGEQLKLPGLIKRLRPDLVHFLSFNAPIMYSGPRITTIHDTTLLDFKNYRGGGSRILLYELKYRAMRVVFWRSMRASEQLITDTEYGKQELVKRGYAPAAKIAAIHLGPPSLPPAKAATQPTKSGDYLLYVGNLYPNKNLRRLIATLPLLRRQHPHLRLVIVGQADVYAAQLAAYADELGVGGAVSLTGFVSDAELAGYYHQAKLYVFPSLSEGFGLPPLEAMALGLPVAAADTSCLPEVLGQAAAYFNPHDPAEMARVIGDLLASPKRLAELRQRGYKHVKTFSWKRMAEQTLALYPKHRQ
jgi:glycosyltransferase involved in cell wall biosynthesis